MIDLVIDLRNGGDWSLDLCFAGLVKNIGPDHVRDIPFKDKHREWGTTTLDWGLERRTLGYTRQNHVIPQISMGEVGRLAFEGEIRRVWIDERMESFQFYRLLPDLAKNRVPVVVVAGHDRFWNHSPQFVASLYGDCMEAMLLDNWYPEYAKLPFRSRRIGWSCNFDHYWTRPTVAPEKDIDICFIGYNSHPDRSRFIDHVNRRWGHLNNHIFLETRPDSFDNFVPKWRLFDIMQRSKICLNLRGAADRGKTLRAYEIPYVGSFMLSQDIDDPGLREDFRFAYHCEYFDNEEQLDRSIDYYLSHDEAREHIASLGHAHALNDLSVESRWGNVLKWLDDGRSVQEAVR